MKMQYGALLCLVMLGVMLLEYAIDQSAVVVTKGNGIRVRKVNNQDTYEALRRMPADNVYHPSKLHEHAGLLSFANYELTQIPTALRSIRVVKDGGERDLGPLESVVILAGTLETPNGEVREGYAVSTIQTCRVVCGRDSVVAWLIWDNLQVLEQFAA